MKHKFSLVFLGIVLIGFLLRFFQLGGIPSSLDWDEVSWGYNAYSILHTGKDEYGKTMPLSFKAFGDYKQPVYVYAAVLPIAFFDLTPFSVRFPSAFFGTLAIPFVYFLVSELFKKEKRRKEIALLSILFFAISPWSIHFSRVAFEANVSVFFVISGTYLLIKGFSSERKFSLILGTVLLSLSCFTYHSQKIFTPIFFTFLFFFAWKFFNYSKKKLMLLVLLFILINSVWVLDSRTTARGRSVLFFPDEKLINASSKMLIDDKKSGNVVGLLIHNRRFIYVEKYIENYVSHFNPTWLFIKGDNPRHHAPGIGSLYFVDLPFILIGALYFIKKKSKESLIVFGWFFLAPVASSLAVEAPNASRSLIFLPTWFIFSATGWVVVYDYFREKQIKLILLLPALLLLVNFIYYLNQNFNKMDLTQKDWQFGYKEAVEFSKNTNKKVFYSEKIEQAYSFYLFYNKYDPKKYLGDGGSYRIWQSCFSINNAYFGNCSELIKKGDIVVLPYKESQGLKLINKIDYGNGDHAFGIYEVI